LPARHRIGVRAYSAYSRASHVANGRFWLIPLGIGGPLLTIGAAIWSFKLSLSRESSISLFVAAGLSMAHMLSTLKAGSINLTQWKVGNDDTALSAILDRFARWQALRAGLQFLTFVFTIWALLSVTSRTGNEASREGGDPCHRKSFASSTMRASPSATWLRPSSSTPPGSVSGALSWTATRRPLPV